MVVRPLALCTLCVLAAALSAPSVRAEEACVPEQDAMRAAYRAAADMAPPRYETVLPFVDAAFACLGPVPTEAHARVSEYEAFLLLEMGRTEQLLLAFERYFRDVASAAPPNRHARQLTRYGFLLAQLNLHGESLAAYAEAAGLADRLTPLEAGRQLSETGEHFRELGRLREARRYFAAADSHFVVSDRPARLNLALLRFRQARLLLDETRRRPNSDVLLPALDYLDEARRIFEVEEFGQTRLPPVPIARATVLRRLGRPADAAAALDRAVALLRTVEDRPDRWVSYYEERVQTALALGQLERAQAAATSFRLLADSTRTLDYQSRAHTLLGRVAEARAAALDGPALIAALSDAEAYYQRAMDFALQSRARYGLMDVAPSAWVEGQRPFRALVHLYLRQGRHRDAFTTLDDSRARYFHDLREAGRRRAVLSPRNRAALDSLFAAQESARRALDRADLSVAERSQQTSNIQRAQLTIDALTGLLGDAPELASPPLDAIQSVLGAQDRALVTYFLEGDAGYVFALTPDTLVAAPVDVSALDPLLAVPPGESVVPGMFDPDRMFDLDRAHQLYTLLLAPVEAVLAEVDALVLVPEGPLVGLPFTLLTTAPAESYTTARYLVQRYALSTSLSASAFYEAATAAPARGTPSLPLLAMGRSSFASPYASGSDALGVQATRAASLSAGLTSLPRVEEELRRAHQRLGGKVFLNQAATKDVFFAWAPEARVVHLASHALVDPDAPMSSFVVLAPDSPDAFGADSLASSLLFLSEVQQASLAADLVLLSACSTERGSAHLSEGMIGLQYAFQAAGARSVLATAWPVNDAAMAELVTDFYAHLADGLPKDRALQAAQRDYRARYTGALAHPSFWAGLVLHGDVSPLAVSPRRPWLWLLLAAPLLTGLLFLLRRLHAPHLSAS
ncbi:MAG: CHAT domain-containing protein [Bacteroidota bacterium]